MMARSGHIGRSLRGQEATHIVIDEAAFIPEALITEVALPMLATTNGQMTLISTPRGMNHFWRFFNFGVAGEHGVWSRKAPSSESPFVVPDFLKIQRGLISERAYRVEYEAEFANSAGRVFRTEAIESCLATELVLPIEKVVIGIDFARYTDYTVAIAMVGDAGACEIREILRIHGASYSVQISQMAEFIEKFGKCQVRFDATGMGGMVYETLVGQCRSASVDGAVFTAPLRSDLIDRLAILVDAGRVKMLPHPELIRELQHFESRTTDKGSKLEAVSGYHDDMVIALALAVSLLPIPYKANILVGEERKLDFSEMFGKVG